MSKLPPSFIFRFLSDFLLLHNHELATIHTTQLSQGESGRYGDRSDEFLPVLSHPFSLMEVMTRNGMLITFPEQRILKCFTLLIPQQISNKYKISLLNLNFI